MVVMSLGAKMFCGCLFMLELWWVNNTSSHICVSWYMPIFSNQGRVIDSDEKGFFNGSGNTLFPFSSQCWSCLLLLPDLQCCSCHDGWGSLHMFYKSFCKGSHRFSNVSIFTVHPATPVSVYHPTFLKDGNLVFGVDQKIPESFGHPEYI